MKYELSEDLKRHWFLCMKALTLRLLALDLLFLFGFELRYASFRCGKFFGHCAARAFYGFTDDCADL